MTHALSSNQPTVSRWERGGVQPSKGAQIKIHALASEAGVASLGALRTLIRVSPFEIVLVCQNGFVVESSASAGFVAGKTILEQTPEDERAHYLKNQALLSSSGFWCSPGQVIEYSFPDEQGERRAVIVSIACQGEIYACVQKR